MKVIEKIFGSYSSKQIKKIMPMVNKVLALADEYKKLSDSELKGKTAQFKERLKNGETLDDILPEAFATVIEASDRVLEMRHFPVQIIGGIILHQGRIAEMKTGEGKTLVATLPCYLNALTEKGVHVVTVNDYLAKYQSEWMGKVYKFLGMSVGLVIHGMNNKEKQEAYNADITYGTNNEFGFDYLRDNMVIYKQDMVQRGHNFAIVDEVDSILIDEARTPLIISGVGDKSTDLYERADRFARTLKYEKVVEEDTKSEVESEADYVVDEKAKTATLTSKGIEKAESFFNVENLGDGENSTLLHHINQAIRAHGIMKRDIDYVVREDGIIIVDEFTGRLMFGRRYSEGLHQAIEAKEGVMVQRESKTLATITFQNYFRLYNKLSGMTGTALTEEAEFSEIYSLDVVEIPTNKPVIRKDLPDCVYKNEAAKFRAVVRDIEQCHEKGQPVLVGTISIEKSEYLSSLLKKKGIKHQVLNAKNHLKEAEIVAQAGKKGAVTIATNMAGRGTDIMLGGNAEFMAKADMAKQGYTDEQIMDAISFFDTDDENIINLRKVYRELYSKYKESIKGEAEEVKAAGGLYIIGTERHESRRIDNQLRGRAGRQGDPGMSRFFISLDDDLMRLFGGERVVKIMETFNVDEDTPIEQGILSNSIESAQKKVEGRNFQSRKHVLMYDDVMNKQRELIYKQRREVLEGESMKEQIRKMLEDTIVNIIAKHTTEEEIPDDWDLKGLLQELEGVFIKKGEIEFSFEDLNDMTKKSLTDMILEKAFAMYDKKEEEFTSDIMRELERVVLLKTVDSYWMDHIDAMDELRRGIGLRAYGQRDPVVEYRFEGFDMFENMINEIKHDTVFTIMRAQLNKDALQRKKVAEETNSVHGDGTVKKQVIRRVNQVGRNSPCPCGSGKKYKRCCGADE